MSHAPLYELEQWLEKYNNFEKKPQKNMFALETMRFFCERFAQPHTAYKSVHVAGSKGKGSVCAFTACILQKAGYRTGLYASPHVCDIRERIKRPDSFFSDSEYRNNAQSFITQAQQYIAGKPKQMNDPTWFELITLFAFVCFKNIGMDWAVFETGMGGRLDATNVIVPQICALTPIELEHTKYLGTTEQAIAEEKAGIIKENVPVCCARQKPEVRTVFEKKAKQMHAPLLCIEDFIKSIGYKDNGSVRIEFEKTAPFERPISTQLHMCGHVQAENAALAALTVKIALPDVSETVIEQGLAAAVLPARFEVIQVCIQNKTITVVIDGFHTPNSARRTLQTFYERFGCGSHLLFACAADKDSKSIARIIKNSPCAFEHVTVTIPGSVKQSDYAKTLTDFNACFDKQKLYGNKDYKNAVEYALHHAAAHNKVLLAAGSFYLAAEVKKILAEITPCAFDEQKPIQ